MAKGQTLHMRIDSDLKNDADALFSQLGITTTDAVSIFLHQALIHGGFPFPICLPNFNDETIAALKEAKEIAESGQRRFENIDEMFESLEKD